MLGVCAIWDIKTKSVPVVLLLLALFLGGGYALFGREEMGGIEFVTCIPGVFCILLSILSEGKIGLADGLLLLALGFVETLEELLFVLLVSMGLCSLCGLLLCVCRRATLQSRLPFVPFLLLGEVLCLIKGIV